MRPGVLCTSPAIASGFAGQTADLHVEEGGHVVREETQIDRALTVVNSGVVTLGILF